MRKPGGLRFGIQLSSSDVPGMDKRLEEAERRIRQLESRLGRLEAVLFLLFVLILIGFALLLTWTTVRYPL
ncbi:hypothetical protein AUI46_04915 [archaeon 13_1_40CM_2_52_13]|nr:MAG: hypothetical protein AUI46_04915 [archaeon 13_1_40CM_2_52_13]OLE68479.1 MAG: hypothetical protein AUF78_15785 [archaeon 13_1_20CM_2_51_12]